MAAIRRLTAMDAMANLSRPNAYIPRILLKIAYRHDIAMATRKSSARKIRLIKKIKQASPVPTWVVLKTNRNVRFNPKRREWRRTDVEVG